METTILDVSRLCSDSITTTNLALRRRRQDYDPETHQDWSLGRVKAVILGSQRHQFWRYGDDVKTTIWRLIKAGVWTIRGLPSWRCSGGVEAAILDVSRLCPGRRNKDNLSTTGDDIKAMIYRPVKAGVWTM